MIQTLRKKVINDNKLMKKCLECEVDISDKKSSAKFCCSICAANNWYKRNREKKKAHSRQYYHSDPELKKIIIARNTRWKKENKQNNRQRCIKHPSKSMIKQRIDTDSGNEQGIRLVKRIINWFKN